MSALSQRMAAAPHVSWRALAVLALLVLALVSAALYAGSQQRRLPAPFGPAANGVIPYVSTVTCSPAIRSLANPGSSSEAPKATPSPQFSPDGTRLAFIRDVGTTSIKPIDIYVAKGDGSDPTKITPEPIWEFEVDLLDAGRGQPRGDLHGRRREQPARPVRRGRQWIGRDHRDRRRDGLRAVPAARWTGDHVPGARGREVGPVRHRRRWVEPANARRAHGPRRDGLFLPWGDLHR